MTWIIDGHNLIGQIPTISLNELDDETRLIDWLLKFLNVSQTTAEVFFDRGQLLQSGRKNLGRLKVTFVRTRTADEEIARHLTRLGAKAKNVTVVSSDHQVQASAKAQRSKVLGSRDFFIYAESLMRQKTADSTDQLVTPSELDYWMDLFNQEDDPR